jgi:hypothetical protein
MAQVIKINGEVGYLLDQREWDAVLELRRTAGGVIRTASLEVCTAEVVPGWWDSMRAAFRAVAHLDVEEF